MLAVTSSQGSVRVEERDTPSGEGELIRVTSSSICGSDLHMVDLGISGVVLGHEFGGYTTDGRLVAVRPTGQCGTCPSCRARHSQTCADAGRTLTGLSTDGGLAHHALVEASRLYTVPVGVDPASVCLVEPTAVCVHGVHRAAIETGMTALVVGAGSIGLITGAVLRARGVDVDIVARHQHQREAAGQLGLGVVDAPGRTYDVTFDAVCTQQSFDACVSATRPGGRLLEFGMFWSPVHLDNNVMMKEIDIIPSIFYGHDETQDDFQVAIDFVAATPELAAALVTHTFDLSEAVEAFAAAKDKSTGAIKVRFTPDAG